MNDPLLLHNNQFSFRKPIAIIGVLFFAALIYLQFHFFELRLLVDGAVSLFLIAITKTFDIAEDRFLIGFNQLLPVVGANMNVPLKTLAISYLTNDVLIYLIAFLILLIPLKDPLSALILILGYVAVSKYHFFIVTYSLLISWPLMLVFFSVFRKFNWKLGKWGILPMMVSVHYLVFGHPLIVVVFGLIWAYEFMQMTTKKQRLTWLIPMGLMTLLFVLKWLDPDPYDLQQIEKGTSHNWENFNWHFFKQQLLVPLYYPTFVITLLGMLYMLYGWWQKKAYQTMLVPIGALALFAVVYIAFAIPFKFVLGHWPNKAFAPTTLLFLYVIADQLRNSSFSFNSTKGKVLVAACSVLIVWELTVITTKSSKGFEQRLTSIHEIIEQVPNDKRSKFIVDADDVPENSYYAMITASEIAIISELFYDMKYTPNVLVNTANREPVLDTLGRKLIFVNPKAAIPAKAYHPYFNFKPGNYREMPFDEENDTP